MEFIQRHTLKLLPKSDAYQNLVTLSDEFGFGTILTFRGPKRLLSDEAYLAYRKSREPQPKPLKIQELLKLALNLKKRFPQEPGLSRRTAGEVKTFLLDQNYRNFVFVLTYF